MKGNEKMIRILLNSKNRRKSQTPKVFSSQNFLPPTRLTFNSFFRVEF